MIMPERLQVDQYRMQLSGAEDGTAASGFFPDCHSRPARPFQVTEITAQISLALIMLP
jgi:hypothetical protein